MVSKGDESMKKVYGLLISIVLMLSTAPAFAVTDKFSNPQDSYVRETSPTTNYGFNPELFADGVSQDPSGAIYGELVSVFQWDVSSIPAGANITGVSIKFNFFDASSGPYHFYTQNTSWSEGSILWDDLDQGGTILGTVPPFTFGIGTVPLNADGVALVKGWVDGSVPNTGLMLRSGGTNNGITMLSKESGAIPPTLEVTYSSDGLTIDDLLARIEKLENLLEGVRRKGDTIVYEAVNVQIINGTGTTNGLPDSPDDSIIGATNGLGNLIVGYDEEINPSAQVPSDKSGSHNIVVGHGNNYGGLGGIVVGVDNVISGNYSSVLGGASNKASVNFSTVSGGTGNTASGAGASVSGGSFNVASGSQSSVSGGFENTATGRYSSVNGGQQNEAIGLYSTVSGGSSRSANAVNNWVAGSLLENN